MPNDDDGDEETKPLLAFEWFASSHGLNCFAVGFKELSLSSAENEELRNERLSFSVISNFKYPTRSHNQFQNEKVKFYETQFCEGLIGELENLWPTTGKDTMNTKKSIYKMENIYKM